MIRRVQAYSQSSPRFYIRAADGVFVGNETDERSGTADREVEHVVRHVFVSYTRSIPEPSVATSPRLRPADNTPKAWQNSRAIPWNRARPAMPVTI